MKFKQYLDDSSLFLVLGIEEEIKKALQNDLKTEGVSFREGPVLLCLLFEGKKGVRPSTLCKSLGQSKASISQILSRLEEKKYLKRNMLQKDARGLQLALTPEGMRKANRMIEIFGRYDALLEKYLNPKHLSPLLSDLKNPFT